MKEENLYKTIGEKNATNANNGFAGNVLTAQETKRVAEIMGRMSQDLEHLNTMRGGSNGFKGFAAEALEAGEMSLEKHATYVINNNGTADLVTIGKNGHKYYKQVKFGYNNSQFEHFVKDYKGQTIIVDKGNPNFAAYKKIGAKYGVKVIEGHFTNEEVGLVAKAMQLETKLTGAKTATFVPKTVAAHKAGVNAGKTGALGAAGFSLGSNICDVITGDKDIKEASVDIAKDTAIGYGVGYAAGAAGSVVASTSVGSAVIGAATTAGAAVANTAVGGAVIGTAAATSAAIGAAGAAATGAVVGAVGTVGSAVTGAAVAATAGTAVGGAVAAGAAATAAGAAAIGAAAVAAAPVVAVGAAIGAACKIISWLWDD